MNGVIPAKTGGIYTVSGAMDLTGWGMNQDYAEFKNMRNLPIGTYLVLVNYKPNGIKQYKQYQLVGATNATVYKNPGAWTNDSDSDPTLQITVPFIVRIKNNTNSLYPYVHTQAVTTIEYDITAVRIG